jgi:hypothetical protein
MSHPLSDPAVSLVAARLGGLAAPQPATAKILEIGCASGLNLIPLALRWPESRCVGIDLSGSAIASARQLAAAAGVTNLELHAVDLRDFDSNGQTFDVIIAHGFLSWVPDEVKAALFAFCRRHLAPTGIVTISFNLESGWRARFPVIEKVRAIQQAGAEDIWSALAILRSITEADSPESAIIDDMRAKGPAILAFDDFGPINDPWPLDRFVQTAATAGLHCLGESDPGTNLPSNLDPEFLDQLRRDAEHPLDFHLAADSASARTFRSVVLCREDAPIIGRSFEELVMELFVRAGPAPLGFEKFKAFQAIASFAPACVSMVEVIEGLPGCDPRDVARQVGEGIAGGWILPRMEPVRFEVGVPQYPVLSDFRLECARRAWPLVDIWHRPCSFPEGHYQILAAMDGTLDQAGLMALASKQCSELAVDPWLRHLAGRGLFG